MRVYRNLVRFFSTGAIALLLLTAAFGLSRPESALAQEECTGGDQLCATKVVCARIFGAVICEVRYYYNWTGGGRIAPEEEHQN